MHPAAQDTAHAQPVARFKPTSGVLPGYAGMALAAAALVYVAWGVHSVAGLRIGLGAVFFAVVVWLTQVRPRATAYPGHVVLKNTVRDAHVPLAAVDEVSMGQTLGLWVGQVRYTCIGIGSSMRQELRQRRRAALEGSDVGRSRMSELVLRADRANLDERATTYQAFVVTRLEELVEQARREQARGQEEVAPPRVVVAWPELALLVVSGLAFAVSLML